MTYTCEQTRTFETNQTCSPVLCTEPSTTGYNFSEASKDTRSREVPTFNVRGVVCAPGYAGTPAYAACDSRLGGDYTVSGCTAVACPENSDGESVPLGCDCKPGYSGGVVATSKAPFYDSTCGDVRCPANSSGTNVARGDCACDDGWEGQVTASTVAPFYVTTCTPIVCTRPRDKLSVERYELSDSAERNLEVPYFDVQTQCEDGFWAPLGTPKAVACNNRTGGPYLLSGCEPVLCDGRGIRAKGNDAVIGRGHSNTPLDELSTGSFMVRKCRFNIYLQ